MMNRIKKITDRVVNKYCRSAAMNYKEHIYDIYEDLEKKKGDKDILTLHYFVTVLDRLIAKASGLLSYNAIILAAFALSKGDDVRILSVFFFGVLLGLLSCVVLFPIIWMKWENSSQKVGFEKALDSFATWNKFRSRLIDVGILLSLGATFMLFVELIFIHN